MYRDRRKSLVPFIAVLFLGAAIPMSPPVQAGSWGYSGGYRGGVGFGVRGHFGPRQSYGYRGYRAYPRRSSYFPRAYGYRYTRPYSYCPNYGFGSGYYGFGSRYYGFGSRYYRGINRYRYPRSYRLPSSISSYRVVESNPRPNAWTLLAEGRIRSARQLFARQAERFPAQSIPKLGYALSAAFDGDFGRAEWAMRRAFMADPGSLGSLPVDPVLQRRLASISSHYRDELDSTARNPNAAFMLAALMFIGRESEPASEYVELAIESGDLNASTFNLKNLLSSAEES